MAYNSQIEFQQINSILFKNGVLNIFALDVYSIWDEDYMNELQRWISTVEVLQNAEPFTGPEKALLAETD